MSRRTQGHPTTGNSDAHLKNWSLLYPDGARPQWSPLYDQVATVAFQGVDHALALRMGTAKHFREVSRSNLVWLGGRVGVEEAVVHRLVEETLDTLRTAFVPDALGMTPELADSLRAHWRQVPLLRRTPLA